MAGRRADIYWSGSSALDILKKRLINLILRVFKLVFMLKKLAILVRNMNSCRLVLQQSLGDYHYSIRFFLKSMGIYIKY